MPIIAHNALPAFRRLRAEGELILDHDFALHQEIRELHIGLLNMMPDAALEATERQFLRLIGESNQIAQFYVHPFTLPGLERGARAQAHIDAYYDEFASLRDQGLDALIITGANVIGPELSAQPFWQPLIEIVDWAYENVTSTLCSCLATHAVMEFRYGQRRRPLGFKRWGVYPHRIVGPGHPLVAGMNTRFDVPHSRFNEVGRDQFEAADLRVLVESPTAGVHLAVSSDQFRIVLFQGHPEYDVISLLKEYKREVSRFLAGEAADYPPLVEHYFGRQSRAILEEYHERLLLAMRRDAPAPAFPEGLITDRLDNTWHDSAEAVIGNWVGLVYRVTHHDRRRPFMDGVAPQDPLGLGQAAPG